MPVAQCRPTCRKTGIADHEEMVRERYSHIEAGELGDVATEALDEVDR
ncbi:hypothetical protein [Halorientalis halophila]